MPQAGRWQLAGRNPEERMKLTDILIGSMLLASAAGCQSFKSPASWFSSNLKLPSLPMATEEVEEESPEIDPVQQKLSFLRAQAELAEQEKNPGAAIQSYESILQVDPKNGEASYRLAVLQAQQGNAAGAEERFQHALKHSEPSAELHNDYGYFCYLQGNLEAAEQQYREATKLSPSFRQAHNNLGLVLAGLGRVHEAEMEFQRAGCNPTEALNNLAFGQLMQQNVAGAAVAYGRVLELDPTHERAKRGLQSLNRVAQANAAVDPKAFNAVHSALQSPTSGLPVGYRQAQPAGPWIPASSASLTTDALPPLPSIVPSMPADATPAAVQATTFIGG
jgi:Tfp pilus assembly protein PilF